MIQAPHPPTTSFSTATFPSPCSHPLKKKNNYSGILLNFSLLDIKPRSNL